MNRVHETARLRRPLLLAATMPFLLLACDGGDGADRMADARILEEALAPQRVRLVSPEVRQEQKALDLVGEVRAFETVPLSTEVVGNIDRVLVEVGDEVVAGSPLVEVDRSTYKLRLAQADANLAAARAELRLATKELERKRDLLSDNTVAQAVYDQAEAAHALAEAGVGAVAAARDLAERDYERSVVRAPTAGTVAKRLAAPGQWADINAPLIELAAGSKIKVAARVPESWAPYLSGIDGFDFTVGQSTTGHRAEIFSVEPVISQANRSFEVVGTTEAAGTSLYPGMFARVRLVSPVELSSMWIPATAVVTSDMPKVMLVENDEIVIRNVQTGRRDAGMMEIVSGLEAGDEVVADVAGLGRGTPVTVEAGS